MHVPDFPVGMLVADAEPVLLAQVAYEVGYVLTEALLLTDKSNNFPVPIAKTANISPEIFRDVLSDRILKMSYKV